MSQTPRKTAPARKPPPPGGRPRSAGTGGGASRGGNYRPRAVEPRRDPFPIILGGIIGAAVVGLMVLVYLLASNSNKPSPVATPNTQGSNPGATTAAVDQPQAQATAVDDAPRMPLADFKKLYDDPAKRPLIIDVRAKEAFDQGHIKGAISFPEADVDTRVKELPKDKLIVAYCQWPAENESARVASKLHSQYGFSYDNLKVLLGGWNTWNQEHAKDANAYPEEVTAGVTPGSSDQGGLQVTVVPGGGLVQTTPAPTP